MAEPTEKLRSPACPICGRAADARYRPFCSRRCADLDLGRWLGGSYAIPAVEPPDDWSEASEPDEDEPPAGRA